MNERDIHYAMAAISLRRAQAADIATNGTEQTRILREGIMYDAPWPLVKCSWDDFLAHCKRGEEILNTHRLVYGPRCGNTMPPQIPDGAVVYTICAWGWVRDCEGECIKQHRAVALVRKTTTE